MENFNFTNLNEFVEHIISNDDLETLNIDFDHLSSCYLTEKNLINLLKKSIKCKRIRNESLIDVFEVVDSNSITDDILAYIEKYPYKHVKQTILMYLSHKDISESLLEKICHMGFYPEAFFSLFLNLINMNDVNTQELLKFREEHIEYFNDLEEIKLTLEYHKEIPSNVLDNIITCYNLK